MQIPDFILSAIGSHYRSENGRTVVIFVFLKILLWLLYGSSLGLRQSQSQENSYELYWNSLRGRNDIGLGWGCVIAMGMGKSSRILAVSLPIHPSIIIVIIYSVLHKIQPFLTSSAHHLPLAVCVLSCRNREAVSVLFCFVFFFFCAPGMGKSHLLALLQFAWMCCSWLLQFPLLLVLPWMTPFVL